MVAHAIVDTGFLIALLNRNDHYHRWAAKQLTSLRGPWLTAEACISESIFLLELVGHSAVEKLFGWLEKGVLISEHFLPEHLERVCSEFGRYRGRWVDFADACLIALSDIHPKLPIATVDAKDFTIYFRNRPSKNLILPPLRK